MGKDNVAADALSLIEVSALESGQAKIIDFHAMASAQMGDSELSQLQPSKTALDLRAVPLPTEDVTLIMYLSAFRRIVFNVLHGLSHPGIRATQKLITACYVWPSINSDVRKWRARSCLQCQRSKVQRHTVTRLATFATPDACFDKIHLDSVQKIAFDGQRYQVKSALERWTPATDHQPGAEPSTAEGTAQETEAEPPASGRIWCSHQGQIEVGSGWRSARTSVHSARQNSLLATSCGREKGQGNHQVGSGVWCLS